MSLAYSTGDKYQLLQAMGIPYWLERRPSDLDLVSTLPIFCANCLVILPQPLSRLPESEHKMLISMLKVLEVETEALCIVAANHEKLLQPEFAFLLQAKIQKWAPKSVLILGKNSFMETGSIDFDSLSIPIFLTYHPSELQNAPELKRKAYETLLSLKTALQ